MIYLKQVKLLDPDLVAGDPEELKYPYKAPAVRFTESFIFRKPVTFLVGENGAGKSTLLEAMMSKYEERDEEEPGMLYDGTEAYKIYANVLPEHIKLIETQKPEKHFFFRAESFFNHAAELDRQAQLELRKYSRQEFIGAIARRELSLRFSELCQPQYIIYIRRTGSRTLPTTAAGPFSAYPRTGE